MKTITLRPAEPERDFGQLAAWFSTLEDEPASESALKEEYERDRERILLEVAETEPGELLGFYWAKRNKVEPDRFDMYLFVTPEQRGQVIGRQLYEALEQAASAAQAKKLRVSVWDTHPECRAFAERRGFSEKRHHFAMALDLDAFDDRPYDEVIVSLKSEGFEFTSMGDLGNTDEAQRKLYALNDAASITTPGSEGEHPWTSFEDFQKSVCQSDWYKPDGQIMAIETATGNWAAMSAITRLEGNDYAYNLFTGVDERYRGRKLGQAVKVLALRYAREVLQVQTVRTHHNFKNLPMIAIDQKLGYSLRPGTFLMEKELPGSASGVKAGFEIRAARLADCRGIAEVQVDSYRAAYADSFPQAYLEHFTYEEQEQDWRDLLTQGREDLLLVALSAEKQVLGYVFARAQAEVYPGYDSEILALHVRQTFQRQGLGAALMQAAAEKLTERGCQSAMLWTLKKNPIRRWYASLQGKLIGEKSYRVDDWEVVEVAYGWEKIASLLDHLQ